ncbi:AsmA family protein [Simiduia aestuariiviva]|uniref:AsmA protein n=1 Tax=Simiduia aestuariiviva TaxID=1510459 RepID=A0A839UQA8_9GAMM|nr:AsmA protein [Simiduia aestuariiviva]
MVRILKVFLVLIVLLVAAVVALVLTFDPNKYKTHMVDAAARQNIALRIDGDLGWQLWPRLAIKANGVSVADPAKPDATIAAIEHFAVSLQMMPLLSRQVIIDGITLTGAKIDLKVNKKGRGNWQNLGQVAGASVEPQLRYALATDFDQAQTRHVQAEQPAFDLEQNLQLDRLTLNDSDLRFQNAEGLKLHLSALSAELTQLKLDGTAFPVNFSSDFKLQRPEASTLMGNTSADMQLKVPAKLDQIIIENLKAPTVLEQGATKARVELAANATILLGRATDSGLSYSGDLSLAPTNLQKLMVAMGTPLPPMAAPEALHKVALRSPFAGTDKTFSLTPMTLTVDDTTITGTAGIRDFSTVAIEVDIQGDAINLDHYLPPPEPAASKGAAGKKKAASKPAANPDALPLEALRSLNLKLLAKFDTLSVKGLNFKQVRTNANAKGGVITLKSFDALLHDGPLNANAVFDARKDTAKLTFKATGDRMPLQALLKDFDAPALVSGNGGVVATGNASGATSTALVDSMTADIQLTSKEMLLHSMNLEKSICQLAMLAQKQEMPQINWADATKLQTLTSNIQYANNALNIKSLNSGVENMALAGLGLVDLNKGALDFKFNLRIDEAANQLLNCPITNKKLLNRDIPVRCKDRFEKLGATSCAPDLAMLEDLYRDEVKSKLGKELDKQLDKNPEAKELLKGLFGRQKKDD